MPVETASPDTSFGNIQRQMQRLMEQMQKGFFNFCSNETWTPNVNLYENDTMYIVCVDLSGVDKEKIEVVVHDQKLTLRGARLVPSPPEANTAKVRVHVMEIDHGPFCREVQLPADVNHHRISAAHVNGLLWIELPKK